jgi:hypothetical protein
LPRRRLSDVKHAGQVDRDDAVPSLGVDIQEIEPVADPGGFDHDIEPAEFAHDSGNGRIDRHTPHQGRWCFGKTPMQTFLDAIPLAKEKLMAA